MIKATSTICYIVVLLAHKVMSTSMKAHDVKQVSQTSTSLFAQTSPVWLSDVHGPLDDSVVKSYPRDEDIKAGSLPEHSSVRLLNGYPEPDKQPSADHPEVQAVLDHLDLSIIPDIEPRKVRDWTLDTSKYDVAQDPDCWWSASLCMKPKANYIPEDIYMCPNKGDWGLNFDDGPYKAWWPESEKDKKYDQPRLYNFLVNHGKQKATLFFVGSNVVKFPEAAIRALNDGHVICSHTWSHPQMTTLTNEQVVAQLYWTQKAIKQTLGITPRCWRPPYGDVDDRVRAIAWQMGMRTILWDQDSNDWNLVGGKIRAKAIDGYFQTWINARKNGTDDEHGHITLQHENSNATIHLSEKWLPKVQKSFRVMPIHQCLNDPHPYWEKNWIYPTLDDPNPPRAAMSDKESNVHGANVFGNANDATSALLSSLKTSLYTTMLSSLLLFLFLL